MTRDARSLNRLWRNLNLLEDWLSTGFSRVHPEPEWKETRAGDPLAQTDRGDSLEQTDRGDSLEQVAQEVASCVRCGLSANRTTAVPGEGAAHTPVLFVGEGPGAEEDRTGRPFVGAAGQYLDKWLASIRLAREECFIANCVKCRPPQNREPHPDEIGACLPYLERQIGLVSPRVICCLGRIAAQTLLGTTSSLGALRGKVHQRKGIPVVVTYHPSAVLRDQSLRKPVWEDLKQLRRLLDS